MKFIAGVIIGIVCAAWLMQPAMERLDALEYKIENCLPDGDMVTLMRRNPRELGGFRCVRGVMPEPFEYLREVPRKGMKG